MILLNVWIFPTGGVALGMVCPAACAAGLFCPSYYWPYLSSSKLLSSLHPDSVKIYVKVQNGMETATHIQLTKNGDLNVYSVNFLD